MMSRPRRRRELHLKDYVLWGVSHVVGRTPGSHACRIGGGLSWRFTSIPVGTTLLSSLVRDYWCVVLKARTETLCLCYRQVSEPPSRRTTVSNRETLRISRVWSLLRRRVLVGHQWFWAVWVVLSILPWVFSPFVVRDRFFSAFRVDHICVCTRAKHGPELLGAGGSDP